MMGYANNSLFSLKAICLFVIFLGCSAVPPKNEICPFNYFFHTGDGYFDTGNAIHIQSYLPASTWPYGMTRPGYPTGRWNDGYLDVDLGGVAMGFPDIKPYLGGVTPNDSAINFAVAGSPILDRDFFRKRNVTIPFYVAPLSTQMEWFKDYLYTVGDTNKERAAILADSMFLFGDIDANDIVLALRQGKSIKHVKTYVPFINDAQLLAARKVIDMGATRVILMGNVPIGCYPYILTELGTTKSSDYDELGCLRGVNDLIQFKNNDLEKRVTKLAAKFPHLIILYADFYGVFQTVLKETLSGPNRDKALKACCGMGGKYNYGKFDFCGSYRVPVCADPSQYIYWDGIHLTQETQFRIMSILEQGIAPTFNCTAPSKLKMSTDK